MVFNLLVGLILVWLVFVTFLGLRLWLHYNRLVGKTKKEGLLPILEQILTSQQSTDIQLTDLKNRLEALSADSVFHLQKIGLVRFNPFADTGGNQSFSLALLDAKNNGLVMTSLYARNGHRWYIKQITAGESNEVELAKEEKAAIKTAQHMKGENQ